MAIRQPRCIRIFKTEKEAKEAKRILSDAGVESYITEDKFEKLTLEDLGMQSRFRLFVEMHDIPKVAKHLAKLLREKRLS